MHTGIITTLLIIIVVIIVFISGKKTKHNKEHKTIDAHTHKNKQTD